MANNRGGIAAWSVHHPVGVVMIALALVVLGGFALERLAVALLPHIIYPEVRVRVVEAGVPAQVMEDRITRQLEEQLAITEDVISVQSRTTEGRSSVDLSFPYGKDIDIALRDASTRLDRAKRFLPETIDQPIIYKRDPSQLPVAEYVISARRMEPVALRTWVDDVFAKWFLTLPGVAAVEVGGGLVREIQLRPDLQRLAALGLQVSDVADAIREANLDVPSGRLTMLSQELLGRTVGRFSSVEQIAELPLTLNNGEIIRLGEVVEVVDGHEEQRIQVRYNDIAGVKVSIQKQPAANTVAVADVVKARLQWLHGQGLIPDDVEVNKVSDQSVYVEQALNNAALAASSGALLAMVVVYIFLGNLRRTLIIGSAIPIAIMVTFLIMGTGDLSLNIMSLGGLALGIGMLVDNTIVMLENIYRHQRQGEPGIEAGVKAAGEINSAIVAATTTNLAAVLPFLFISGLVGLIFRELIFTISAAIVASLLVAITVVPALSARVNDTSVSRVRIMVDGMMERLQLAYAGALAWLVRNTRRRMILLVVFAALLVWSVPVFFSERQEFLPKLDDGQVQVNISADSGMALSQMDDIVQQLESLFRQQPEVEGVFTLVGGYIFGRTEVASGNSSSLTVQLKPLKDRRISSEGWIQRMRGEVAKLKMAGVTVRMYTRGIRGLRTSRGSDDVSLRIQGSDLATLERLAEELVTQLRTLPTLRNQNHSAEEVNQELSVVVDRERAALLGLTVEDVGEAVRTALSGNVVSDYLDADRSYDIRLQVAPALLNDPQSVGAIILFSATRNRPAVYLRDVARLELTAAPAAVLRDNQLRIVEVNASLAEGVTLSQVGAQVAAVVEAMDLPEGYSVYDAGSLETLREGRSQLQQLLFMALFLVFVVMAVQYESLRNPVIIMLGVPFAAIGVAVALRLLGLPLSMPVWLGLIMLAGIVVNNAIVLVEYIEILRRRGEALLPSVIMAARLRLRPILMTTLTTVVGMAPLALGLGEGAEMLQPLAVTIVAGLSFSLLVSLLLIPTLYLGLTYRDTTSTAG